MDAELRAFLDVPDEGRRELVLLLHDESDEVEADRTDGPMRYRIKPLDEVYGPGKDPSRFSTDDDRCQALLYAIETAIVEIDESIRSLTDGQVLLTLKSLAMKPGAPVGNDLLARRIQFSIRVACSLGDYNRGEVRAAIKKVIQSVERQTAISGRRGYLDFLVEYMT